MALWDQPAWCQVLTLWQNKSYGFKSDLSFELFDEGLGCRLLPLDEVLDVVDEVFAVVADGRDEPEHCSAISKLILNQKYLVWGQDWPMTHYKNGTSLKSPFSQTLLLYQYFASQMALLGFYHNFSLFTSPMTSIHARAHDNRYCSRDSECGGVPERIGALKIIGHIQVRTSATCVAGECFILWAMPLEQKWDFGFDRLETCFWGASLPQASSK